MTPRNRRAAPHPALVSWLDLADLDGADALVLEADGRANADEVRRRGAKVTRRTLTPDGGLPTGASSDSYGLVVVVGALEALQPADRPKALATLAALVADGGWLAAFVQLATSAEAQATADGPPWPLAPSEFADWTAAGLHRIELSHPPADDGDATVDVRTIWTRRAPDR